MAFVGHVMAGEQLSWYRCLLNEEHWFRLVECWLCYGNYGLIPRYTINKRPDDGAKVLLFGGI